MPGISHVPPEKKNSRWEGGLLTCLRNRRFHRPSWSKTHFKTPGFGFVIDLMIIGVKT
jgi:hypothetical protein